MKKAADREKTVLQHGKLQKSRRELREYREDLTDELARDGKSLDFHRQEKKYLKAQIRQAKREIAKEEFQGNNHALMMTELRQETQAMEELMQKVTSEELVKARGGKKVTLQEFAYKQAFGLGMCSKKAIYQHNSETDQFMFKHTLRCGRRTCPVCAHFDSLNEGKQIIDELQSQLQAMSEDQLKKGRLFHITLTHENVPLERVFEIYNVWRHIQVSKKKVYKKKENTYSIWNILQWGIWRWEVTRNEETGLYHPHIHIMAFANGWLGGKKGGYWNRLVESWKKSCKNAGLKAHWKGQDRGVILFFRKKRGNDPRALGYKFTREELAAAVEGSVAEMAKYAVKSTDFTKIKRGIIGEEQLANEMAKLFSMMAGRKIKNGFGGFSLSTPDEEGEKQEETPEEVEEGEHLSEVVYAWNNRQKRYVMQAWRPWSNERFVDYLKDMGCYKDRHTLMMHYGLEREAAA